MSETPGIRFRAAGIPRCEDSILFQRNKKGDAWVLPGGRVELQETSVEALEREFREELGLHVRASRPICIVENLNAYAHEGLHEISICHLVTTDDEISVQNGPIKGIDPTVDLTFRWISVDELDLHKIYPRVLKRVLKEPPEEMKHFTNNDKEA